MNLLDLQRRMSEDVRRPLTAGFKTQMTAEDGRSTRDIAASYVKPNPVLSSFERIEIYNRQYWFRLIEAVSEDYPALNAVLGSERFDDLVLAYIQSNPSTSFTLRNLGGKLPTWLVDHPEFTRASHDLAVDVARLEWAYVEAFDSASLPPLIPADFASLLPMSVLSLQPHLQLLELRYPIDEIVLAARKGALEVDIASNAVNGRRTSERVHLPRVQRSRVWLAVHRFDDSVFYRRVDREEFLLLTAIRRGKSIGGAISSAFGGTKLHARDLASKTQEYFAHASELGWFISTVRK